MSPEVIWTLAVVGFIAGLMGLITFGYKVGWWSITASCVVCPDEFVYHSNSEICMHKTSGTVIVSNNDIAYGVCPPGYAVVGSPYNTCLDFNNTTKPIGMIVCPETPVNVHNVEVTFYIFTILFVLIWMTERCTRPKRATVNAV